MENSKLTNWILKVTVGTLASIVLMVVAVLMVGVFLPNEQVDNKDIFSIIGPAFNTVIGAFVGLLGGLQLGNMINKKDENKEETSSPPSPEPEKPLDPVADVIDEVEDHIA